MSRLRAPIERGAFDRPVGLVTRILIDENLSPRLAAALGPEAMHATAIGERMSDVRLWHYAREHGYTILTKDADFFDRLSVEGAPPKVIWVRSGNLPRAELETAIVRQWPVVIQLLENADLIEIHGDRLEAIRFK